MKTLLSTSLLLCVVLCLASCKGNNQAQSGQTDAQSEIAINEKFIPYFSLENGKYQLSLTQEEAAEIGIDAAHYQPVKATIDTFNLWIEKYHITPEQVESGEPIAVCTEEGDTLHLSFMGLEDIVKMKEHAPKP